MHALVSVAGGHRPAAGRALIRVSPPATNYIGNPARTGSRRASEGRASTAGTGLSNGVLHDGGTVLQ
jgi:hypothetical protein